MPAPGSSGSGGQPEEVAVAVKAPGATGALVDLEGALVAAVEQLFPRLVVGVPVGQRDGLIAMPRRGHDGDRPARLDAIRDRTGYQVLQRRHAFTLREHWVLIGAAEHPARRRQHKP